MSPQPSTAGDFVRCFSWNPSAGAIGDGPADAEDWFRSDACEDWASTVLAPWLLPAVALAVVLAFFPLLFILGRYACDCCGGRKPSTGCLTGVECSHDAVRTRRYSNRVIATVRLCAAVTAVLLRAGYGALAFANERLHNAAGATLDGVDRTLDAAHGMLGGASAAADASSRDPALVDDAPSLHHVVQRIALLLAAEDSNFAHALGPVTSVLADLRRAEDGGVTGGRSDLTLLVPSPSVVTFIIVAVLVALTLRVALPPFVVLACWLGLGPVVAFAAHALIGVLLSSVCGAYEESLGTVAVGALSHSGVCNSTAMNDGLFDFADRYESVAWALPGTPAIDVSPVCDAMRIVCERVACTLNTCGGGTGEAVPFARNETFNVDAFHSVVTAPFSGGSGGASITSCAQGSVCPSVIRADAAAMGATRLLARFDNATTAMVRATLGELLPAVEHCDFARQALHGPVRHHICGQGGVQQTAMTVAYVAAGMVFLVLAGLSVLTLAIKRAVPLDRARAWHDPHGDLALTGDSDDDGRFDDLESSLMGTTNGAGAYAGDPLLAARRRVHELTRALANAEAEVRRADEEGRQEMARLASERDIALADAAAKADEVVAVEELRAAAERKTAAEAQSRRAAEARAEEESRKASAAAEELEGAKAELARAQERAAALTLELAEAREVSAADFVYDAGGEAP
jgi:hypothetical protein